MNRIPVSNFKPDRLDRTLEPKRLKTSKDPIVKINLSLRVTTKHIKETVESATDLLAGDLDLRSFPIRTDIIIRNKKIMGSLEKSVKESLNYYLEDLCGNDYVVEKLSSAISSEFSKELKEAEDKELQRREEETTPIEIRNSNLNHARYLLKKAGLI